MGSHVIQRTEIQARIQRGLHLKSSSPAPHVHDLVVPVIIVEDLSRIDDNIQLSDQRPFWGTNNQPAAGAGLFSEVKLVNVAQADSKQNRVVVLDRVTINIAGSNWGMLIQAQSGGSFQGWNRDSRYSPIQGSIALLDAATPGVSPQKQIEIPSALTSIDNMGIVLSAGFEVVVVASVANIGITVGFMWREFDTIVK